MIPNIRFATENDIFIIHQLANKIWPETYGAILSPEQLEYMLQLFYSIESLKEQMEIKKHIFLIVESDEMPIGYASYAVHENSVSIFHLHKIYLLPIFQGKNFGKILLEFILEDVKNRGGKELHLNVNRNNRAQHFYKKYGFQILREEDIDIGNGYFMNDYVMGIKL